MAATLSGARPGPPRRPRKQTQTTKSHRYEPFTRRVAKLKIDPIHRVQQSRLKESSDDLSQSFFRAALDEWSELNLTSTFTVFLNKVNPLSENLPQLLHHADTIAQSLLQSIEKQDSLALEALLSLVAHLAHDLGQDFEKYFAQTVSTIAKVSVSQDDPAVIESCFTCLAWIYKYLSRLLVQDLRPLLDILLPYFSARKDYIRRFTSESLAFLFRKAAVQYAKNEKPLQIAVSHILQATFKDAKARDENAYLESCLLLLTESAVSVDAGLHSSAPDLFLCVFDVVTGTTIEYSVGSRVVEGLLISLIHRTDATGFRPVLELVTSFLEESDTATARYNLAARLLLVAIATRSGSRINDWNSVVSTVLTALNKNDDVTVISTFTKAAATILQYCPLDQLLPSVPRLTDAVVQRTGPRQFFSFCESVAELGKQRFQDLLLPHLQKYIISHWSEDSEAAVITLADLHELGCIDRQVGKAGYFGVSEALESSALTLLNGNRPDGNSVSEQCQCLLLARSIHFPKHPTTAKALQKLLADRLAKAATTGNEPMNLPTRMMLGWEFQTLLETDSQKMPIDDQQYMRLLAQPSDRFQLLPFVEALSKLSQYFNKVSVGQQMIDVVGDDLTKNMLNASIALRKASIGLLQSLLARESMSWLNDSCDLISEFLSTTYSISNARQLAMLIRRIPILQKSTPADHKLFALLPLFTMGLIPHYHDQLRKDLASVLGQMIASGHLEDMVVDIIRDWLQAPPVTASGMTTTEDNSSMRPSPFECTKLNEVDEVYHRCVLRLEDPKKIIESRVEAAHTVLSSRTPANSRLLALQVLMEIPQVAEKRSKILIPAFLAAQRGRVGQDLSHLDESQSVNTLSPDIEERGWTLRERKLFLQLLGLFNNPRVLYRVDDVRVVLLDLLSNGDAETRKLSLLALLKWKDKALLANRDVLLGITEDNKTTSEIGSLLNSNEESGSIDVTDRSDLLPVLLRLVFGQLVGRVGVPGTQEAKRKSLLRLIFRMREEEITMFLDVVKGRLRDMNVAGVPNFEEHLLMSDPPLSDDQQYGFLRMCLSMMEILQTQFRPFGSQIIDAVLYCTTRACHQIHDFDETEMAPALTRNIRRVGVQCLNLLFEHCPQLVLEPYIPLLFSELIKPRLAKFVSENAQGVSGLLRMFSIWAGNGQYCSFLGHEGSEIAKSCWNLLGSQNTKPDVKVFILLEIIGPLLDLSEESTSPNKESTIILRGGMTEILNSTSDLLQQNLTKDLLFAATKVLQRLAGGDGTLEVKEKIVQVLVQLLREPTQRLPPHVKAQVLKAIEKIVGTSNVQILGVLGDDFFDLLSSYFDFFRDVPNRDTCCRILSLAASQDSTLISSREICENLNATSRTSLDETDHKKQDIAFASIHALLQSDKPSNSFLPVLHNLIYLTRTSEETAVRGNALGCLKNFVTQVADGEESSRKLQKVLLQSVRKQLTNDSETVRADFVELLGGIVKHWESEIPLQDMHALLVGDDEEASFFTNILHIQQHRRNRAMRRLTSQVEAGLISAENVAEYFLPLLQKFANDDSNSESALSTKGQSVASIMVLLQWLEWKSFRRVFRQYRQTLDQKRSDDKIDVRLLSHAADALTNAMTAKETNDMETPLPHLAKSLPSQDIISSELKSNFLPKLTELSHYKDEGEIDQRIPAAVVAVKLIKLLPKEELALLASPVVLDVAQVLRSRTQETRDLARNKLAEIVNLLGPISVQFVLKELGTALTRGYQLHVLGYTMHTILLASADTRKVGDLDYCIEDVMKVILDDIFGVVGQEKENQDYISSMKEVKRNKSFDSIEILANSTSVKHLAKLVLPFESLLAGSLTPKQIRNVDELFRRIGVGISHSSAANSQELLVLAFELIASFYRVKPAPPRRPQTNDEKNRERFLIQKDNVSKVGRVTSSSQLYKIAKFAIDIARSTFSRHSELMTPENVHGFVPVIGDALIEGQEDVKVSALRLLSTIIKLKLPEFEENAKLYVLEAVKVVKGAVNTNEEAAQAALKLVAAILREKRDVEVRESDVAYLLKRTMPDLEEPDRQGVTFSFVKAVMARKMQMPEVYELVDQIGLMMVTSQNKSSRDAARGVYVHFLLDYPQGKTRWTKQVKFLVKNLEYQHPEGRQSVMEAISNLHAKLDDATAQETAAVIFIPLVLRMSNDENLQCREMAAALIARLFQRTPSDQINTMLEPVQGWLDQGENMALKKLSLQTWSIFFNSVDVGTESLAASVRSDVIPILQNSGDDEADWEVKYQAMELVAVLVAKHAALMLTNKQRQLWTHLITTLTSRESWLQQSAAKLVGLLFQDCATTGNTTIPLTTLHGLKIDEGEIIQLVRSLVKLLKHQTTSKELAQTVIQNLTFLGRIVITNETHMPLNGHTEDLDTDNEEPDDKDDDEMNGADEDDTDRPTTTNGTTASIPIIQYILDQATHTLRREPPKQTSSALQPKISFATLLTTLTPHLTKTYPLTPSLTSLLLPLLHITSPTTTIPRSSDLLFAPTYTTLTESCQLLLDALQAKLGDQNYMRLVTSATKLAREKRTERRSKRAFDVVAEPERAAREKMRKVEKKKVRRKEVKGIHRGNRRKDLGF